MIRFAKARAAWGTSGFENILKKEVERLDVALLPLQQGLASGNYVLDESIKTMMISCAESADAIQVRAGIFYQSTIAGCSCTDDPTPAHVYNEYCEIQLEINKETAEAHIKLLST